MANLITAFGTIGTTVCFGSLEFVSTSDGMLVRVERPAPCPSPAASVAIEAASLPWLEAAPATPECHGERLWHHLDAILGAAPTKEDLHRILFAFTNIQGQLAGGEPLSLELLRDFWATPYPHGLHNATHTVQVLMARSTIIETTTDDAFVGIIKQLSESFFDLLDQGSEMSSDSESDNGNSYPSRECHMVQLVPIPVQGGADQPNPTAVALAGDVVANPLPDNPPVAAPEQLQARRRELEETRRQLEAEDAEIERELQRRTAGGRARAVARDVA